MARTFNYAVIRVLPDARRGERVNVGVVVLAPNRLDFHIRESRKVYALTGVSWEDHLGEYIDALTSIDQPDSPVAERMAILQAFSGQVGFGTTGWFEAEDDVAYLEALQRLLIGLVDRPRAPRVREEATVTGEIVAELRSANILAGRNEALGSGKVVRNFQVEPGLEADFAQLNGALHVAAVLDLRGPHPHLAQAALKAVTLDRARQHYDNVHRIGVIAVPPSRVSDVSENINLLRRYADDVVNWGDSKDRSSLKRLFFDSFAYHTRSTGSPLFAEGVAGPREAPGFVDKSTVSGALSAPPPAPKSLPALPPPTRKI